MADPDPPPTLDYGHQEPPWKQVGRVATEKVRQDHLNPIWYWVWYSGGPRSLGCAVAAGAAFIGTAWAVTDAVSVWPVYAGVVVVFCVVRLRPRRRDW